MKRPPGHDGPAVTGESFALDLNAPRAAERIDEDPMAPTPPCVLARVQVVRQKPVFVEGNPRADTFVVRPALHDKLGARIGMNFDGLDFPG